MNRPDPPTVALSSDTAFLEMPLGFSRARLCVAGYAIKGRTHGFRQFLGVHGCACPRHCDQVNIAGKAVMHGDGITQRPGGFADRLDDLVERGFGWMFSECRLGRSGFG